MQLTGTCAILLLAISIVSYGLTGVASAQSNLPPVSVETDFPAYGETGVVTVSGHIKDSILSEFKMPVTIKVQKADGSLVGLDQVMLDRDGDFSTIITPGGAMTSSGEYTITATYNSNEGKTTFTYTGGSGGATVVQVPEPVPEPVAEPVPEPVPEPVAVSEPVAIVEPEPEPEPQPMCGEGTVLEDGKCVVAQEEKGGGCLIATAAFGSEMAPQVQFLREIRDNTVLQTQSGTSFMTAFNSFYYTFSPTIADYERDNPDFKEAIKVGLTPLLTSLTILNYVDIDTEQEMLGYGIGIIMLNIGMYFVAPAVVIIALSKKLRK